MPEDICLRGSEVGRKHLVRRVLVEASENAFSVLHRKAVAARSEVNDAFKVLRRHYLGCGHEVRVILQVAPKLAEATIRLGVAVEPFRRPDENKLELGP